MNIAYLGNKDLLQRKLTAFLASRTVQTDRVMACYDWATSLNAETECVVSGFQSPIEQDVLHFLLKRKVPVIVVLARAMYKSIPPQLQDAYTDGRVLLVSISNSPRNSNIAAKTRNQYVAELASTIVFGMLNQSSSLYDLYRNLANEKSDNILLL